jgi:hypothetical protein
VLVQGYRQLKHSHLYPSHAPVTRHRHACVGSQTIAYDTPSDENDIRKELPCLLLSKSLKASSSDDSFYSYINNK